jgi:hypothetical protein
MLLYVDDGAAVFNSILSGEIRRSVVDVTVYRWVVDGVCVLFHVRGLVINDIIDPGYPTPYVQASIWCPSDGIYSYGYLK